MILKFILIVLISYLLGSIPSGVLVSRRAAGKDVRRYGSGKTGTTNVLRVAGGKAAALVVIFDILKGALAVFFAGMIASTGEGYLILGSIGLSRLAAQVIAALAAIAGHNWPIFLKFRGGRGVATFFGGLAALCPAAAIFGGEVFFIGAGLTKYASVGSISGVIATCAILVPLTVINGFPLEYLLYTLVGGTIIIAMHRDNIARLIAGKERRIGDKSKS